MTIDLVAGTPLKFHQFIQNQIDSSLFFASSSSSHFPCSGMQPDKNHDRYHLSQSHQSKSEPQPSHQQQEQPQSSPHSHHHLVTTGFLSDTPPLSVNQSVPGNSDEHEIAARLIQLRNTNLATALSHPQEQPPLDSTAFTQAQPTTATSTEIHAVTATSQGLQSSIQPTRPTTYGGPTDAAAFLRYTSHAAGSSASRVDPNEAPSFSPGSTPAVGAASARDRSLSNPGRAHRFCHACKHINHVRRKRCEKCNTPKSVTRMSASSRARYRARRREATEHMLLPAATSPISGLPTASLGSSPLQLAVIQLSPPTHMSQHQAQHHPQPIQLGATQARAPASPQHPSLVVTAAQASSAVIRREEEGIQTDTDRRRQELDEAIDNALDGSNFPQY